MITSCTLSRLFLYKVSFSKPKIPADRQGFYDLLLAKKKRRDLLGGLTTAGHRPDNEGGTVGGIAADKDILGVLWVFWLQESHSEEYELCLDNLRLAFLYHDGTTTLGIGLPVDLLYLHTCELTVLA